MSGILNTLDLVGPGSYGLNTQDNTISGAPQYATVANNCVIDQQGRLSSRKGFVRLNNTPTATPVNQVYTHFRADGGTDIISARELKLWRGQATFTQIGSTVYATDNWQFASFNGYLIAAQKGAGYLVWAEGSWTSQAITAAFSSADAVCTGFGRVWAANTNLNDYTVYWSELLNPRNFTTADSGSIDMSKVFVNGKDSIVALSVFNNRLIIFCKNSIYAFQITGFDPSTLALTDTIENVGCVSRDSVQSVGDDIVFLSQAGLMSLGKLFDSNFSFPINNYSRLVQDDFINTFKEDNMATVRGFYVPREGTYLIGSVSKGVLFVFNMLARIPELNLPRITTWSDTVTPVRCGTVDGNGDLLVGMSDGIYKYSGYGDIAAPYKMTYFSQWLTFDRLSGLQHLKKARMLLEGGSAQTGTFRWAVNYKEDYDAASFVLDESGVRYYYDDAEYNLSEYGGGIVIEEQTVSIGSSGTTVKVSVEAPVSGDKMALQVLQLYANKGKIV
jgi:hypothetical protein